MRAAHQMNGQKTLKSQHPKSHRHRPNKNKKTQTQKPLQQIQNLKTQREKRKAENPRNYRREGAGGVDGEEGDLVDFGAENGEAGGGGGGEGKAAIAGREESSADVVVVEEGLATGESESEAESVPPLDLRVRARAVDIVRVLSRWFNDRYEQDQQLNHSRHGKGSFSSSPSSLEFGERERIWERAGEFTR